MPGIACVGVDTAGGSQMGGGQSKFKVRGIIAVVLGDPVTPHPPLVPPGNPHIAGPTMATATSKFRIGGIPVCRAGHLASCGHATSGRGFFRIP
ncbi:PAAR domain-containing protein [Pararhizobium haloflavum]|uniref:PAAR domain-containing protein n=1 Tax=Pararhizobium haloflavum TaxID=2037914 RepID=UPI000C19526E|nr:PAAR domain-containing protein [Pararhizobium haloflavum]